MYRLVWLSAFAGILSLYFIDRLWILGLVSHCVLLFAWLVVGAGDHYKKDT